MTESDGKATRGSSGLFGGAFFLAPPGKTLAKQLAVERRVCAPLNAKAHRLPGLLAIR
jgi:hypothetical protein